MRKSTLLKVSRPGLWLVFIWLYLWPSGARYDLLLSPSFWMGLVYCTFPLNLLVYGMNDLVDEDVDFNNPRKDNYVYGAKTTRSDRKNLPQIMFTTNIVFLCALAVVSGEYSFLAFWFMSAVAVNYVYNNKPFQLSRMCPYEIPTMVVGHLLIPVLSARLNQLGTPSVGSIVFHILLLCRSHIFLELIDVDVDRKEGKRTLAVVLGKHHTLMVVVMLTMMESVVGLLWLNSLLLSVFSASGAVIFVASSWSPTGSTFMDKKFVSTSQALVGALLMIWLWRNGVLA